MRQQHHLHTTGLIHEPAVRAADGTTTATSLRLFTTLLDHRRYPAAELAELYHRRWQAETAYFGLKVTLCGSDRVLRSRHTDDARQEPFGLLIVYQASRQIAADAALQAGGRPVQNLSGRHHPHRPQHRDHRDRDQDRDRSMPVASAHSRDQPRHPASPRAGAAAPPDQDPAPPRQTPDLGLRLQPDQEEHPDPQREDRHHHHHSSRPNTAMEDLNFPVLGLGLGPVQRALGASAGCALAEGLRILSTPWTPWAPTPERAGRARSDGSQDRRV
ncbi:hypothetical protein [Streptomyces sp. UNOC14_S4]|uniref:hypothetical protein n=1 Tax=Streptomyces sp. UNOC14_S4 TaxID=2872340 RepID=UPI001E622042|nr:hypothetical protein [Streptomyces sp. UNOC14_S4]MCC3769177.1 hypothetical protein [Streptomyces sp. UNOC14_S4]